ncbi:MAG: hypothetical protein OMM_00844 [Candidatus Magnetoglobus multicellularis str. Araruama]|uniref:Uncharacterized protein n=1 Tax=Candidatus Magnetoglobus multicellularis str. Araruama TaxID=890399 RepID=A0A1V1PFA0_9BACT|nr:MAG: hypothetical protein OMM_00844 [Candidatus Magnetoglobus multicellularis str. Araruama]
MKDKFYIVVIDVKNPKSLLPRNNTSMDIWMSSINQRLFQVSKKMRLIDSFANTGCFVLHTTISNQNETTKLFQSIIGYKAPVLSLAETHWFIEEVRSIQTNKFDDCNYREGIAFQLEGSRKYFDFIEEEWATVSIIMRGVAGIKVPLKKDYIQKKRKQSLWPVINRNLCKKLGGQWTIRNIMHLNGTLRRALMHIDGTLDWRQVHDDFHYAMKT